MCSSSWGSMTVEQLQSPVSVDPAGCVQVQYCVQAACGWAACWVSDDQLCAVWKRICCWGFVVVRTRCSLLCWAPFVFLKWDLNRIIINILLYSWIIYSSNLARRKWSVAARRNSQFTFCICTATSFFPLVLEDRSRLCSKQNSQDSISTTLTDAVEYGEYDVTSKTLVVKSKFKSSACWQIEDLDQREYYWRRVWVCWCETFNFLILLFDKLNCRNRGVPTLSAPPLCGVVL